MATRFRDVWLGIFGFVVLSLIACALLWFDTFILDYVVQEARPWVFLLSLVAEIGPAIYLVRRWARK